MIAIETWIIHGRLYLVRHFNTESWDLRGQLFVCPRFLVSFKNHHMATPVVYCAIFRNIFSNTTTSTHPGKTEYATRGASVHHLCCSDSSEKFQTGSRQTQYTTPQLRARAGAAAVAKQKNNAPRSTYSTQHLHTAFQPFAGVGPPTTSGPRRKHFTCLKPPLLYNLDRRFGLA